jgi:hypothetical protein
MSSNVLLVRAAHCMSLAVFTNVGHTIVLSMVNHTVGYIIISVIKSSFCSFMNVLSGHPSNPNRRWKSGGGIGFGCY